MTTATLAIHGSRETAGLEVWADVISSRTQFKTSGSLRSQNFLGSMGRLNGGLWFQRFQIVSRHIDYVIYSYDTPIAWHDSFSDEWFVPDVSYSPTTTRQQSRVRTALRMAGIDYQE